MPQIGDFRRLTSQAIVFFFDNETTKDQYTTMSKSPDYVILLQGSCSHEFGRHSVFPLETGATIDNGTKWAVRQRRPSLKARIIAAWKKVTPLDR
jgi:hypothetical protein